MRHMKLHRDQVKRILCRSCGWTYSSKYNFEKHLSRRHRNDDWEAIEWETVLEKPKSRPTYKWYYSIFIYSINVKFYDRICNYFNRSTWYFYWNCCVIYLRWRKMMLSSSATFREMNTGQTCTGNALCSLIWADSFLLMKFFMCFYFHPKFLQILPKFRQFLSKFQEFLPNLYKLFRVFTEYHMQFWSIWDFFLKNFNNFLPFFRIFLTIFGEFLPNFGKILPVFLN